MWRASCSRCQNEVRHSAFFNTLQQFLQNAVKHRTFSNQIYIEFFPNKFKPCNLTALPVLFLTGSNSLSLRLSFHSYPSHLLLMLLLLIVWIKLQGLGCDVIVYRIGQCLVMNPSHFTPHTSHLIPHTSHLTLHTSHPHITPHTSHLTPHTSHPMF